MDFHAVRQHFSDHRLHMAGCAFAIVLVVAAVAFGAPVFALLGALVCGTMMVGMVWMMVGMATKHRR
jgi:hypothetical protein